MLGFGRFSGGQVGLGTAVSGTLVRQVAFGMAVSGTLGRQVDSGTAVSETLGSQVGPGTAILRFFVAFLRFSAVSQSLRTL